MVIKNEQQFYSFLYSKGISKKDYLHKQDLYSRVIEENLIPAIEYIIKVHPAELGDRELEQATHLSFGLFKKVVNAVVQNNTTINLEDLLIFCFGNIYKKNINDILLFLIETHNVDPNGKTGMIFTEACHYGIFDAVKYFIEEKHVDPNINDEMGYIFACRFEHYEVAKYLVEHGANYKTRNSLGLKLLEKSDTPISPEKQWLTLVYEGKISLDIWKMGGHS